ncbi:MAG: prepilin-type N-terminal cleavage/methylation domain-containing protein [Sandaracinus sp.]
MTLAPVPHAVRHVRRTRRRFGGFTLLELMIVVTIIAISAALAAPAIGRAMAISRADRATHDLLRIVRNARSLSLTYGRAYLLRFNSTGDGRAELWQGTTSACRLENWTNIVAAGNCQAPGAPSDNCVDYVDSASYDGGYHHVRLTSVAGVDVCFQPNGDALTRPTGGAGVWVVPPNGVVNFQVDRMEATTTPDPVRGVVLPFGAAPRRLR